MYKPPRFLNPEPSPDWVDSSEALQSVLGDGKSPLGLQFLRWKLWMKWPEFVGEKIAKHCEPVRYRDGTLYVWVKSSAWMQQLVFGLDPMREQINRRLGLNYVTRIHLTLDRSSVPGGTEEREKLRESLKRF